MTEQYQGDMDIESTDLIIAIRTKANDFLFQKDYGEIRDCGEVEDQLESICRMFVQLDERLQRADVKMLPFWPPAIWTKSQFL